MTSKPSVLFITNKIPHYRKGLYELLGHKVHLTIAHPNKRNPSAFYNELVLGYKKFGPFIKFKSDIKYSDYDVVVIWGSLKLLNLFELLFEKNKNFKLVLFGPGVASSYNKKYDSDKMVSFLNSIILKRTDAAVFYDDYPVTKYSAKGINPNKLFVAFNTVVCDQAPLTKRSERDSFLFIGSLYREKGIQTLLEAYKYHYSWKSQELPRLNIIGNGPEEKHIKKWIHQNNLHEKIILKGKITDDLKLKEYFQKTIACISPNQAGLSVQKSFAYGVPFVTTKYPVSGGEYSSIIDNVTGFIFDGTIKDLSEKLAQIYNHQEIDSIYENCYTFYHRFRSPESWVNQFCKALDFSLKQ